ncbi:PREDICTED: disrupted in renal carcinoma protein 2 homolog [Amphimedon queenslandica]|uniref:Major facilitator superfamily (MFS) profile domain-containing protein n=1 Tax=Amphimedon queenslandica TaxID=400682 RepID=A0AAN0J0T3_AMPQE|nr:PREDICTED: disrupted in renal carcinoma protein 2 homolog [Amphimedon queenslandica]|eukprot:XP_019850326.1 PREDICTED: disrupted in renal carcinoma protein 2 homolog [Amphimedon queenslandica]
MEEQQLEHKTYAGRYYVLVVLSLLCALQNIAWITFSPIVKEAKLSYGLTDIEITLLPAYSPMCFVVLIVPFTWFLQKFGVKIVGVSAAWILAIGCTIRVFIPFVPEASNWIWVMHIGHILIGYVGLPVMILPPIVSSAWFRPKERTLTTAISVCAQAFGQAVGFVMISFLTKHYGIRTMLYVMAELGVFVAALFTIYFPSKPPTPPSVSAEKDRTSFALSFKKLICNPGYILLVIGGGIGMGIPLSFQSVLSIILNKNIGGFNENVVIDSFHGFISSTSWLGFAMSVLSGIFGQIAGFFADRFQKRFKIILCLLLLIASGFFLWFSLSIYGYGSQNTINLFITFCMADVLVFTAMPIFYEAVIEATYPVAEGTSSGFLTLTINIGTLLFSIVGIAGVFSDKHPERAKAMSWVATGGLLFALVLVLFYREGYKRLAVDVSEITSESENDSIPSLLPPSEKNRGPLVINK